MIDLDTQSIRAKILQTLGERCQLLLVLLPNDTEVEPNVYWARQSLKPETEVPAVVITPDVEEGDRSFAEDLLTMPVIVDLVCLLGNHNAVDLSEYLLAEMRKGIPLDDPTFNGLAINTRYVGGGVEDYPEEDDQALVVKARFEIKYETIANKPEEGV